MDFWLFLGTTVGVWATLSTFSLPLYGENPSHRVGENMFVAVASCLLFLTNLQFLMNSLMTPLSAGKYYYVLPLVLGFLVFARLSPKYAWIARYPLAVVLGTGIGLSVRGAVGAQIVQQIKATVLPIVTANVVTSLNNLLIVVFVVTGTTVFLFSTKLERLPGISHSRRLGRYVIMAAMGAGFAGAVTMRISVHVGRAQYLWSPVATPFTVVIGAVMIVGLFVYRRTQKRKSI